MALPVIPGVVRAAVSGVVSGGGKWVNVWHWQYADGASSPGPIEIDILHPILSRIYSGTAYGAGTPWISYCPSGTQMQQIDYTVLNGTSLGYSKTASGTGAASPPALPAEVAACLSLKTDIRGRRYRGRVYLPAPVGTAVVLQPTGLLQTAVTVGIVAQVTGAVAAAASSLWKPVVASYGKSLIKDPNDKYDKIEVSWAPFATVITSWSMNPAMDVQRGRKA